MARVHGCISTSGDDVRQWLDAVYFRRHGSSKDTVDHVMDPSPFVRHEDEAAFGQHRMEPAIVSEHDHRVGSPAEVPV